MNIDIQRQQQQILYQISGDIDEAGAAELKQQFNREKWPEQPVLVLDFRNVTRIGSAGLGKLLLFYKEIAVLDGRIRIENAPDSILRLLKELKLDTLFTLS